MARPAPRSERPMAPNAAAIVDDARARKKRSKNDQGEDAARNAQAVKNSRAKGA